jgi:pimeloyl-ACP methyl ester carboxylesterase
VLAAQEAPTILVGHSYGGAVISVSGTDAPHVAGLVYIAAFAPDEGEGRGDLLGRAQLPPGAASIRLDQHGFLWIAPEAFRDSFAHNADDGEARMMAAVQKPIAARCFDDKVT